MERRSLLAGIGIALSLPIGGCLNQYNPPEDTDSKATSTDCAGSGIRELEEGDYPAVALANAPEPYEQSGSTSGDPSSDVYNTHPLEFATFRSRVEEYNDTRDPTILYHRALKDHLEENPGKDRFSLQVTTLGERVQMESKGPYNRDIYGFKPTECETETVKDFGEVTFVPEIISTKIGMTKISREDVPRIAGLSFVIQLNYAPDGAPN